MKNPICRNCKDKEDGCEMWCPDYAAPLRDGYRKNKKDASSKRSKQKHYGKNCKFSVVDDFD